MTNEPTAQAASGLNAGLGGGKYDQFFLLEIAESANPPENQPGDSEDWCGDVEMLARDGWKVTFFYDCGELDYIDHFISPDGELIDVWPDTPFQGEEWLPTMNWRSMGDLARLRRAQRKDKRRR
jgi:hypothetical protein